jgi:hypothetical protein
LNGISDDLQNDLVRMIKDAFHDAGKPVSFTAYSRGSAFLKGSLK